MTYSDFHYDYDERAHGSVWDVYNSRLAAMRAVAPEEVSHHMVRLAISALKCALAAREHDVSTAQSAALVGWFCEMSPDVLIRITAGAPDQGQVKALIAWHLTRAAHLRSRLDLDLACAQARAHDMPEALEFIFEIEKDFSNNKED